MLGKIGAFFNESKQELAKVNWPSRDELFDSTVLVIVITFLVAGFIFVIDFALSFLMRLIVG